MTKNVLRLSVWERWLLNAGAALGLLCLVLAGLALVLGLKPLIVVSGSMSPGMPVGSLALAVTTPASEAAPGQVVSVVTSNGTRITHRVVSADPATGMILKGDANPVADLQAYTVAAVDRVVFSVPLLGYVASWLGSPWVVGLGGGLCAYLLYVAFFRGKSGPSASTPEVGEEVKGKRRSKWLGSGAIIAALAVVIPLGVINRVEATQAAWTASAVASKSLTAASVTTHVPGALNCAASGTGNQAVEVSWSAPGSPPLVMESYRITVTVSGKSNSMSVPVTPPSKILSLSEGPLGLLGGVINLLGGLLELLLGGAKPVDVSVVAVFVGGWESAPKTATGLATISQPLLPLGGPPVIKCN